MDFSYLHTVIDYAAFEHRVTEVLENLRIARKTLGKLGMIGKSKERDRRPTQDELVRICAYFAANRYQKIPMHRIVPYAVATALREAEICRIEWEGYSQVDRTQFVAQRKHPTEKETNDHTMPLVTTTGYDPIAIIEEQGAATSKRGRIFPYNSKSVGTAFRRACQELRIVDLHFHDLRHEGISRLFEADWDIPQVASVSGHHDWNMLKRYTHLRPSVIAQKEALRLKKAG
jgi:integrase